MSIHNSLIALACGLIFSAGVNAESLIKGTSDAGKEKSLTCGACHGADGNSANPEWPSLAGQHALYSFQQLQAYKSGARKNVLMTSQAMLLDEQDMRDLAVYFEAQAAKQRAVADVGLIERGRAIYIGGDSESGVSACIACHGPAGRGNPAAPYPGIAGQYAVYTATQLRDYASGVRQSDDNQVMRNVAAQLSDDDIVAVASYLQGLVSE